MPNAADAVWIDVLPNMRGFGPALSKDSVAASAAAGKVAGMSFGKAMIAGVAVVATGAVLATKALYNIGSTFDEMSDTIQVGTGKSGKALDGLVESAKNVGKKVPSSFQEIGDAIATVNQRLGTTGEPLEVLAGKFLNLSRITGTDLKGNVASMTRVFGDWGITAAEQPEALDKIFKASQLTGVGLDQLSTQVVKFGAPLRQFGFSFEESLAMFGKWEKEGVNTQLVLGGMRKALATFSKAGEDPRKALQAVQDAIKGAGSAAEANKIAIETFGMRAGPDMSAAIREGRFEIEELAASLLDGGDSIDKADKKTRDFSEQWTLFKNNVLLKLAPIAARVFGAFSTGMQWVVDKGIPAAEDLGTRFEYLGGHLETAGRAFGTLVGWVKKNSDAIMVVTVAVLAGVAAYQIAKVGLVGYLAVTKAVAVAQQAYAFWTYAATGATNVFAFAANGLKVALLSNPIGLVIVLLVALGAGLVLAYKKSETFRDIVDGAWKKIQEVVSYAWEKVIKPVFAAWWSYVTNILVPVILWLWNNVVQPAFNGISKVVSIAWAMMRIAFDAWLWMMRNVVAPVISWLWNTIVKPVFTSMGSHISWVWNNIIKPVFSALGDFISNTVAPAFSRGVEAIKSAWDTIKAAAAKPINFIIETVYTNGIKKVFDKIAAAVGSDVRLPAMSPIATRARGGFTNPGWTLVGEEGPELVNFSNPGRVYTAGQTNQMMSGGETAGGEGFGGPIDWITGAKDWVLGRLKGLAKKALDGLTGALEGSGGGLLGSVAGTAVKKAMDLVLGWAGKKDETEGTATGMGKVTKGNGTGSAAGLIAFGRLMQSMGARVTEHPAFGGVGPGHASTAQGGKHYLGRAVDVNYGPGGENPIEKAFFDRIVAQGVPQSFGLSTIWRAPGHFNHMHNQYDNGGWLPPGVSSVVNKTGKPEAVLTNADSLALQNLVKNGSGVGRDYVHVEHLTVRDEAEARRELERLAWSGLVARGVVN